MSRLTPFDLVFGELAAERFAEIRAQAQGAGQDTTDRARFAAIPAVQRLLADIESPELLERQPAAAEDYLTLLYAAYRFWDAGRHVHHIPRSALDARALPAAAAERAGPVPNGACYLQLPERWFWARIDDDAPHEPLDGLFATESRGGREVTIVGVLGLRAERNGFSQVTVTLEAGEASAMMRDVRHPPFAPTMAGGELADVHSLESAAELLYLTQLALLHAGAPAAR